MRLDSVSSKIYACLMDILFQINQLIFYIFVIRETATLTPREENYFELLDKGNGKHISCTGTYHVRKKCIIINREF